MCFLDTRSLSDFVLQIFPPDHIVFLECIFVQIRSFVFWWCPIYLFWDCDFVVISESLPNVRPQQCSPMFSSKSFIVLSLTFRSLIRVESLFIQDARCCSSSFYLRMSNSFSTTHWKDYPLSIEPPCPFTKISWSYVCGYIFRHFILFPSYEF